MTAVIQPTRRTYPSRGRRGELRLTTAIRAAAAAASLVVVAGACPAHAVTIELKDVASDRIERQRAAAEGNLPLSGTPDVSRLKERLADKGLKLGAPVLLRAFKSESVFEVWMRKDETYVLFATYPVCHWSGTLGPKLREGDKQTPEGFYTVTRPQMRHVGRWPRSLNLGFPNVFDKAHARSGSHILVHGGCSSVGCFAMTNAVIEEIYRLTEEAIGSGQNFVPVHVFPFRLTDENLASQKDSPWHAFWSNLKEGHDIVERTGRPPRISVCENRYRFQNAAPGEGADAGPLEPCGETRAAIQGLEQLSPIALAQLTRQMNPPVPAPRSLRTTLSQSQKALAKNGPSNGQVRNATMQDPLDGQNLAAFLERAARTGTPSPPCSIQRASCRRFIALQERNANRRMITADRRRTGTTPTR